MEFCRWDQLRLDLSWVFTKMEPSPSSNPPWQVGSQSKQRQRKRRSTRRRKPRDQTRTLSEPKARCHRYQHQVTTKKPPAGPANRPKSTAGGRVQEEIDKSFAALEAVSSALEVGWVGGQFCGWGWVGWYQWCLITLSVAGCKGKPKRHTYAYFVLMGIWSGHNFAPRVLSRTDPEKGNCNLGHNSTAGDWCCPSSALDGFFLRDACCPALGPLRFEADCFCPKVHSSNGVTFRGFATSPTDESFIGIYLTLFWLYETSLSPALAFFVSENCLSTRTPHSPCSWALNLGRLANRKFGLVLAAVSHLMLSP